MLDQGSYVEASAFGSTESIQNVIGLGLNAYGMMIYEVCSDRVCPLRENPIHVDKATVIYVSNDGKNSPFHGCFGFVSERAQGNEGEEIVRFYDLKSNAIAACTGLGGQNQFRTFSKHRRSHFLKWFSFSTCGRFLQTSGEDNSIYVYDSRRLSCPLLVVEHDCYQKSEGVVSEWFRSLPLLASACDDQTVRVWDVRRSPDDAQLQCFHESEIGTVSTLTTSLDNHVLIGTSMGKVVIFDDKF